jgi:hypothetical protein
MLPRSVTVGPLAAPSANNIATSQTPGAAGNLTLTAGAIAGTTPDTPRRVLFTPAGAEGTNSTVWTVYGTDWNNNPVSETVNGVNNPATVYTVYDYKTVTRIAVNKAQVGAVTVGTNQIASSRPIFLDTFAPAPTAIQVSVSGTVNYTVQQSLDDPNTLTGGYPAVTWLNHPDSVLVAATGSAQGNYAYLPRIVRVTLNTETAGAGNSITMTVIQADA